MRVSLGAVDGESIRSNGRRGTDLVSGERLFADDTAAVRDSPFWPG